MAGMTFFSISAAMDIIQAMTAHTLLGGIFEPVPNMAKLAVHILVFTPQGKVIDRIMIKA